MFGDEKRAIILDEGVPVTVTDYTGNVLFHTKTLIGKASKQSQSEISHEHHRKGHFLPELEVINGLIVSNQLTKEQYLVLATMIEGYGNEIITKISRLVMTNATVTVTGLVETADENGDIINGEMEKVTDLPVYIMLVNAELKQYQPGQFENTTYVIYAPATEFDLMDKIAVNMGGPSTKVKLQHIDYLTYPGLALLFVKTETRT